MLASGARGRVRRILLYDIWRNLALVLGLVQVQILHWLLWLADGVGIAGAPMLLLSLAAMLANHQLLPTLRRARAEGGMRRGFARLYMNLGIATLLIGLAVGASWLVLYPLAQSLALVGLPEARALDLFRLGSDTLVGSVAAMYGWGISFGQAGYAKTHVRVGLRHLDERLAGLRIVQISDLHIGNGLEGGRLDALVKRVNETSADVVVVTGDLFDHDPRFVEDGARRLGALRARLGVYAVLGNHDAYTGSELVAQALERHAPGIELLRGRIVRLPLPAPLYLAGVDDPGRDWTARDVQIASLELLARSLPADGPTLLLAHRPEVFHQACRLGFPLVLAGHTHGGQIALPLPGGHVNPARIVTAFDRGLYQQGDTTMYVSRGVGMAGPRIRFNCSREIATIELAAAAAA